MWPHMGNETRRQAPSGGCMASTRDAPMERERERAEDRGRAGGNRRPARVLFLHPSDELYGSDLVLLHLVRGLDRARFEPIVVLANDLPYEGRLSDALRAGGIDCRHLPIAVARRTYLSATGVAGFLRRLHTSTRE